MPDDRRRRLTLLGLAVVSVLALVISVSVDSFGSDDGPSAAPSGDDGGDGGDGSPSTDEPGEEPDPGPEGEFFRTDYEGLADPAGFTKPYPNATVEGLLTFRATRRAPTTGSGRCR